MEISYLALLLWPVLESDENPFEGFPAELLRTAKSHRGIHLSSNCATVDFSREQRFHSGVGFKQNYSTKASIRVLLKAPLSFVTNKHNEMLVRICGHVASFCVQSWTLVLHLDIPYRCMWVYVKPTAFALFSNFFLQVFVWVFK